MRGRWDVRVPKLRRDLLTRSVAFGLIGVLVAAVSVGGVIAFSEAATTAPDITVRAVEPTPVVPTIVRVPTVSIAAVGDLMFARDTSYLTEAHGPAYLFERVQTLLAGTDLRIGNFEGTFTERGVALEKEYAFRAPPVQVAALNAARFDAVSLGNNHAGDFGREGVTDTLTAFASASISAVGAGLTSRDARTPVVLLGPDGTVALLSYSEVADSAFASELGHGVARASVEAIREDVSTARGRADFVVVALHAGTEYVHEPTAAQRALARAAIDAGASLVIGHHPHVLQGWERYNGGLILYSLGNFVFDLEQWDMDNRGPGPFQTGVAAITLRGGSAPALEFRAAMIDVPENRPRPATAAEIARILEVFRDLGGGSGTAR